MNTKISKAKTGVLTIVLASGMILAVSAKAQTGSGRPLAAVRMDLMKNTLAFETMLEDGNSAANMLPWPIRSGNIFSTAEARSAAGATMIPAANRILAAHREIAPTAPASIRQQRMEEATVLNIIKVGLGDTEARQVYAALATSGGTDATLAAVILAGGDYLAAGREASGQIAAIKRLEAAYQQAGSDAPLLNVPMIFSKDPPAPEALASVLTFLRNDTHSRFSAVVANLLAAHAKVNGLLNQPMKLEFPLLDGAKFSTAQWKGKVVLVDFWLMACEPCVTEDAEIKRIYTAEHDKGFEVAGYACDNSIGSIKEFLGKYPWMTWPQMFNTANPGYAFPAKTYGFGMGGVPATLLIDRKGILRDVHFGMDNDLGTKVAKLLAEAP
jgi:thiol-disulfide isomerase/thioredoxin